MCRIPYIFPKLTKNFIEFIQYINIIYNLDLIYKLDFILVKRGRFTNYIDIDCFKKF